MRLKLKAWRNPPTEFNKCTLRRENFAVEDAATGDRLMATAFVLHCNLNSVAILSVTFLNMVPEGWEDDQEVVLNRKPFTIEYKDGVAHKIRYNKNGDYLLGCQDVKETVYGEMTITTCDFDLELITTKPQE